MDSGHFSRAGQNQPFIFGSMFFVIVISFCHGLYSISGLATFMYQKEVFKLSPEFITLVGGFIDFPWCVKPIFGYTIDSLVMKISKTKYILFVTTSVRFTTLTIMAHFNLPIYVFYLLLFINTVNYLLENIIAEYILVCMTKDQNSQEGGTNNQLPIYFGFRAGGSLIGGFFGGRIINSYGNQAAFMVASFVPFILLLGAIIYQENERNNRAHDRTFKEEFQIMKRLLLQDNVLQLILFICLINLTPNFDSLYTFYMTDYLKFSTEDLANFSAFATCCYIIGLVLYYYKLQNINPKNFYISTNFVLWVINFTFLLVVLEVLQSLGIDVKIFCLLTQGASTFVAELNFMPILAIWCALCPKNLEGTSITLFTGLLNLSNNSSLYFGSFLMWLINITETDYHRMWQPVLIQQAYLLIMIVGILFIEFPDPTKNREALEQQDNMEEERVSIVNSQTNNDEQAQDPRVLAN
jgi:hypothetical protein